MTWVIFQNKFDNCESLFNFTLFMLLQEVFFLFLNLITEYKFKFDIFWTYI